MPLDGHSFLVSQGWSGAGTALRAGAISRPLAIPQKKNLAGLGKDRDDAFPFWDHVFSAAAKSIKLRVLSDDENDSEKTDSADRAATLMRTSTGIISGRRPPSGTPADSGACTPDTGQDFKYSLIVTAKREAARKGLYSRFFRGPVLGPGTNGSSDEEQNSAASETVMNITSAMAVTQMSGNEQEKSEVQIGKKRKKQSSDDCEEHGRKSKKKRKEKERKGQSSSKKKIKTKDGSNFRKEKRKLEKSEPEMPDVAQAFTDDQGAGMESIDCLQTDEKKKEKREKHFQRNIEMVRNDVAYGGISTSDDFAIATGAFDNVKKKKKRKRDKS